MKRLFSMELKKFIKRKYDLKIILKGDKKNMELEEFLRYMQRELRVKRIANIGHKSVNPVQFGVIYRDWPSRKIGDLGFCNRRVGKKPISAFDLTGLGVLRPRLLANKPRLRVSAINVTAQRHISASAQRCSQLSNA